jgi:hypothetical protein
MRCISSIEGERERERKRQAGEWEWEWERGLLAYVQVSDAWIKRRTDARSQVSQPASQPVE